MCTLLQSNASYGMGVAPDIWETFLELQMKKPFSYVIFKIEERQPQVVVKMTGDTINSYDDLYLLSLKMIIGVPFMILTLLLGNVQKSKIFFIAW